MNLTSYIIPPVLIADLAMLIVSTPMVILTVSVVALLIIVIADHLDPRP